VYRFSGIPVLISDLKSSQINCVEIVQQTLEKIKANTHLNIFLEVFETSALAKAIEVDEKIKSGKSGRLAGVIVAIKDNICYKDHKVSASSKILENFTSIYSATVIEKLLAEDAIIIGRTNCDEFAMGSSNENSAYGNVLNPINNDFVPGGSSGGSAAAVAAGLCHIALGSDTGGSIRQPASFCGVVGLKPTYGRVSRYGLIAYASSFDQIGPITHNVLDAAIITEIISGADEFDATASSIPVPLYAKEIKTDFSDAKPKIAFIRQCLDAEGLDAEVKSRIKVLINRLSDAGFQVEAVDFPYLDYLVPTYYVLTTAEASSNLSRFSGAHYGFRSNNATDLESTFKKSRTEGFGEEVKRRIMLGTFVLSAGYYDAYYSKGQKVRRLIKEKTSEILDKYDFILTPSTPAAAFNFGKNSQDPIKMYLEDIFTVQANITGMPAISIPAGNNSINMPFGLQLMGKHFDETNLLRFAAFMESAICPN
jgi:aspartyl-tRNA(Asn)/glutamyl-tRNA(Gln) amidotransferase subunit A